MELFTINRYTGDDPADEITPDEEQLRKKLLKKIKKRKKLSQLLLNETSDSENKEQIQCGLNDLLEKEVPDDIEPVKRKKRKMSDAVEISENTSALNPDLSSVTEQSFEIKKDVNRGIEIDETTNREENKEVSETQKSGFTILKDVYMSKKEKVKRKLPNWLTNPSVVSVDLKNLTCAVDSLPEIDDIFVDKLKECNITHFFPVQTQVIPWLLRNAERPKLYWPNDICVSAPTGSGKTLAFVLPLLQILYKRIVPKIRALVVLPVQDLANQVFNVFETYSKPTNLNVLLLSKKRPFEEEQSLISKTDSMGNNITLVDIIVTTPGRLVDHLTKTKGFCLDDLTYLVIDEADRVMEIIQNDWLYHLNKHINSECVKSYQIPIISYNNMINKRRPPNKLLFSATLSQDPEKLQQLGLFQPKLFTSVVASKTSSKNGNEDESKFIGKYTTPAELTEYYINSTKVNKPLIVYHLLKSKSWKNVLCFVNSTQATFRLAFVLKTLSQRSIKVGALSASLSTKKRIAVLQKFSNSKIDVLVSSDALARGIDIPNVQYVISYDAPKFIKTYIHRIGRTGRAGKEGTSVVLLTQKEKSDFEKIVETAGKTSVKELHIEEEDLEQYQESYEMTLKSLETLLENKRQQVLLKIKTKKKMQIRAAKGKFKKKIKKS